MQNYCFMFIFAPVKHRFYMFLAWRHPYRAADQWPWSEHFGSQSYFQFNSKEQRLPDDFVLGLDLKLFDKQFAELIRAEQLC